MRTIDADALLADFKARAIKARNWKENAILNGNEEATIRADATIAFLTEVKLTIENAPTVEERPKGKWIRTGSLGNGNSQYTCSNCHYCDEHAESQEVPYCWHCGADMRGDE